MNKKELVKLLFQHDNIRTLIESRQFDASTLKRVISEEIMREAFEEIPNDADYVVNNTPSEQDISQMTSLIEDLKLTLDEFKGRLDDVKNEFTQARTDRDRLKQRDLADEKKMIASDIDQLEVQIRRLEADLQIAYEAAGKSPSKEDDVQVAKIAKAVKDVVTQASDNLEQSKGAPGNVEKIVKSATAKLGTASQKSKKVAKAAQTGAPSKPNIETYGKGTIDAIKKVKTLQVTTSKQIATELISNRTGIGLDDYRANSIVMKPIVAAVRRLLFLAGLTFGIENITVEDVMYFTSFGRKALSPKASEALEQLKKKFSSKDWNMSALSQFVTPNKQRQSVISQFTGDQKKIIVSIIQREIDAAKSKLSAAGISMKPFADQEAGSSAPSPQAAPTKPKGRKSRGAVKLARRAIAGEDVEISDITPQDVKAAVVQDSEEIKSDPEMKQNAKDLMQQVQAPEEETTSQLPAGKGWKDAKDAARKKVTEATTIEQIAASLESADAFKDFWGVKGEGDAKMEQARELFDDEYFAKRIEELKSKATEENKDKVAEEAANLAATVMGYGEFLNNMTAKQPDFKPPEMDFPQAIPTTEEEFNRSFIQPLVKIQEPTDASVDKDGLKEEQYVELFTTNAANNDTLRSIIEKDLQVFGGWYIMSRQSKSLNENRYKKEIDPEAEPVSVQMSNYGNFNDFWDDTIGPKFISNEIKKSIRKRTVKKDPKLEATLAGIQTLIDSGQILIPDSITIGEDPNKEQVRLVTKEMAQQVIENTPEVEPDVDADLSPLATEEMDTAWATTLDTFFGKSRENSSFMRQFLLKNQASMLYGMIDVLGQITTGGAGNEERAYTGEKTQVKQKEQPAAPPAEAEKEANPPKTNTTTTDTSADDEEMETTAAVIPESLEEQVINEIFGMFGGKDNEDKEIKFSPKSTSLMRQDLEAMVDLLRSLKTDIGQYKKYSTSSSVDPRFDGSTLKRAMDAKLKVVQQSIAHLTKVIDIEVQSQKDQLKADGAQAGQDSVDLQEATGSDRKVRIAEVEKVYNEMRRQYLKGLKVSLSSNDAEKAKAGAKELKNYVMGQETFMSYFPSNIITSSGGVMTLGAAHESMVAIIAPFIETIRDIVTITKTQKVSESNLQQAIGSLVMISDSIESMFKVPSLIDREFMQKYIEAAKQNPENQPLTDEEPGMMDKARELTGKALDKLKQMFSWMSNETRKLLLKFFGEDSELIDGLSNSDLSEEQQEALVEDIVESKTWYQNLEQDAKSAVDALVKYLINEVGRDSLKQLNYPAVVSEKLNNDERRTISNFAQETQETFGKELSNRTYKFLHAADEDIKVSSMKLMVEETDDLVSYLTTIFKIVDKISKEAAEEMVSPQTATITQGDQDPNVEDEVPEPENLGKDNSELEDVDGFDDSEKTDDSGTPEDEDDIADFNREVESVDEFLPRLKKPTNPIAKQIQPIKDGFVDVLSKQKKIPVRRATEMFNKFFLLIFKQMNKDLVMEDKDQFAKTLIPKIKQDTKRFISSLGSDELKIRDFDIFFKNIKEADLIKLIALVRKYKVKIAKIVYGEKGQVDQDNSEKAVRGQEVTLQEALRPIIEKMLNEHYNH